MNLRYSIIVVSHKMSNTAYTMNRNNNNNNTRDRHLSSGDRNPNPAFNRNRNNGSRDSDSREYNPFQRNNRSNNPSSGGAGYHSWKNKQSVPEPPKEKVLVPEDFPALPSVTLSMKPKTAWSKPETSLADHMKELAEKERVAKEMGRSLNEPEEEKIDVIPLSSWLRSKHLAKQRDEHLKHMEMEAEEANYRWQMSRAMFPPQPEPEVPVYDENADIYDEDLNENDYDMAEAAPEYEERI